MKKIMMIILLFVCAKETSAQGIGSFFTQGASKIQIMLQQIVLQQTYLSEIKKGYAQTQNGLNAAHDLKNGTYKLHQDYFNSLTQVSPAVKNNPKIALINKYQQQLMSSFDNEISWQTQQAILGSDEIAYIQKVYNNMLTQCSRDLDELQLVVSPGTQMKDEERIRHIDLIYAATNDKYAFSQSFLQNAHAFALDRQSGKQQTQVIKKLYDIN